MIKDFEVKSLSSLSLWTLNSIIYTFVREIQRGIWHRREGEVHTEMEIGVSRPWLRDTGSHEKLMETRADSPLEPVKGTRSHQHLVSSPWQISGSWPPELWENTFLLLATKFGITCYSNYRKQKHQGLDFPCYDLIQLSVQQCFKC